MLKEVFSKVKKFLNYSYRVSINEIICCKWDYGKLTDDDIKELYEYIDKFYVKKQERHLSYKK